MMKESRNYIRKRVFNKMLMSIMIVGGAILSRPLCDVQAAVTRNTSLNIVNFNSDQENSAEGWHWKNQDKTLTLDDGFKLDYNGDQEPALKVKANTKIVLKGKATI